MQHAIRNYGADLSLAQQKALLGMQACHPPSSRPARPRPAPPQARAWGASMRTYGWSAFGRTHASWNTARHNFPLPQLVWIASACPWEMAKKHLHGRRA